MKSKKAEINLENRIQQFLTTAGQVQKKALKLGKENFLKVLENEITIRHTLSEYFNEGLALVGKGLVVGRKATEMFSAGTHRRAKRLESFLQRGSSQGNSKNATSFENRARKNLSRRAKAMQKAISKDKKPRFTTGPASRSH